MQPRCTEAGLQPSKDKVALHKAIQYLQMKDCLIISWK